MQDVIKSAVSLPTDTHTQPPNLRELFLENVIQTSTEGILLALATGNKLQVSSYNPLFIKLLGIEAHPIDGISTDELTELIKPRLSTSENDADWIDVFLQIPQQTAVHELILQDKDYRVLRLSAWPATDQENMVAGILLRVRDITHDKNLEQQLLHTQKMEGLGTLAGGIAHDFNNILTAILGYTSALKVDLESNPQALNKLDQIIRSSHRASDLTRNLLAFSRKNPHLPRVLNLNVLVRDVVGMLEHAIRQPINIDLELAPDLPNVSADPAQMTEAITQLAVNARDAILGSGTIKFSTRLGYDNQSDEATAEHQFVVLDVEDDGVGIPKDLLSRIFEPFYTTKETGVGSGLGLSMVYGAVKQHFGFVEVESAPNLGSRFSIYLPATDKSAESFDLKSSPSPAIRELKNCTVLVVDDEEDIRSLCAIALEDLSCRVLTAADGQQGVEVFSRHADEIDLVLLDLTMPKMDGRECFSKLQEIKQDAPVMISSGYSPDIDTDDMLAKGALGFIEKPYSMTKLVGEVQTVISTSKNKHLTSS